MARKKHVYQSREAAESALWAHAKAWGVREEELRIARDLSGPGWVIERRNAPRPRPYTPYMPTRKMREMQKR